MNTTTTTITKAMIDKAIPNAEITIDDIDGSSIMKMRLCLSHDDLDFYIRFDVYSNDIIETDTIISKLNRLGNLKNKMMANLIKSHKSQVNRNHCPLMDFFICNYSEDELSFEPDALELIEQQAKELDKILIDAVEETIKTSL